MKKLNGLLIAVLMVSFLVGNAEATLVRLDWTMNVTNADSYALSYNRYGLGIDDSFSAFAIYDNAALTGSGEEFIYFAGSTNRMQSNPPSIPLGTFNEAADDGSLSGGPYIRFLNGSPTSIAYNALVWVTQEDLSLVGGLGSSYGVCTLKVFDRNFALNDVSGYTLRGVYNHFRQSPVPEPATMLLLGSGLVGLAGLRRKFKK